MQYKYITVNNQSHMTSPSTHTQRIRNKYFPSIAPTPQKETLGQ